MLAPHRARTSHPAADASAPLMTILTQLASARTRADLRTSIYVPLWDQDTVLGVLGIGSSSA